MDIPFSRWYPVIEKRRSRRHFDASHAIEPDKLSALDTMCKRFVPFPSTRLCLVTESVRDVFKGIIGSYGKIKDAPAFIAFIGNMDSASAQEEVGYAGEGVILEATALGLNTCWVAGFFKPGSVASLWIRVSIQAARLAPSAVNRQPWGFDVQDGSITVYVRTGGPELSISKRFDCGIAMLHIEVAALNCGTRGNWQFLKAPQVARFSALA